MKNTSIKHILSIIILILLSVSLINCKAQTPSESVPTGPSESQPLTTISSITGDVSIMKAGSTTWSKASVGMTLQKADKIKTGPDSIAIITFFEGSTIELDSDTEIGISELSISQDTNTTTVKLYQEVGKTTSRVQKLVDPASRYEVETPAGSAVARGSLGIIIVYPNGDMKVVNSEGIWCTTARGREICFSAGFENYTVAGEAPGAPVSRNAAPPPPPPPPTPPQAPQDNTGPEPVSQVAVKDQSMEETDGLFASIWGFSYLAQTFTAGMTGNLVMVDLYLFKYGAPAPLVIELRDCVDMGDNIYGPGNTVLSSIEIPAGSISDDLYGSVGQYVFAIPYSVTAGTHYSIVLHQKDDGGDTSNFYGWLLISYGEEQYLGGDAWQWLEGWQLMGQLPEDFYFATYVLQYANSGTLEFIAYDCNQMADFSTITCTSVQPANTLIQFQIATNNDNSTWNLVGPDGTASTFYTTGISNIWSEHDGDRYIKYKAFFSTSDTGQMPL